MPTFKVIEVASGSEVYRYTADAAIEWRGMEYATHDHLPVDEPAPAPAAPTPVYDGRRVLTKSEFLSLLTQAERIAIRQARGGSAALDDYLYLLELAYEVNLDNPNTQAGLSLLERAGILAAGRAGEVMRG